MFQLVANRVRRLRFSLRLLLVAITALCVWLAVRVNEARQHREALKLIHEVGGSAFFEDEMIPVPGWSGMLTPAVYAPYLARSFNISFPPADLMPRQIGTSWLQGLIGDEYFRKVYAIYFINDTMTRHSIEESDFLRILPMLCVKSIALSNVTIKSADRRYARAICDADLAVFEGMNQLLELQLNDCNITDDGLKHFQGLRNLQVLDLRETNISDAGLRYLRVLSNLKYFAVSGSKVTSKGFREFQNSMPNCKCYYRTDVF